jgi:NAD(P)-dependent dehydrogenase (short-subunit alcohol dehydrogenase family)
MLTTNLSDHLVLVTGGTGGRGKATGLALASRGGSIAVHHNTAADTAEELIQQLHNLGHDDGVSMPKNHLNGKVEQISDVAPTRFVAYMPKLRHPWATPSILFKNVGLAMGKFGVKEIFDLGVEEFEQIWPVNCGLTFFLT